MKSFIVLAVIISIATATKYSKPLEEHFKDFANEPDINLITDEDERPPISFNGDVTQAKITKQYNRNDKGKFNYNFETQNGINIASIGKLKDEKTFVVSGSYSYTGANGKKYRVRYTADEFGYHPVTELEEIDPIQPIIPQTTPAFGRTAKKLKQTEFGFNNNFNGVQTTKVPLEGIYQAPHTKLTNILQAPFKTSQRFEQKNLQAKNGPLSGTNSSLTTKQFNQANGPFSSGTSSFTFQRFGEGKIQTNKPFSSPITSLTSQQFGQRNIQSNRPFSAPLSNSVPNNFNDRAYSSPIISDPVNSRTYLPTRGYLPPQMNDFSFQ